MNKTNPNKWIVVAMVFVMSSISFVVNVASEFENYPSLVCSVVGIFAVIFYFKDLKLGKILIRFWFMVQFITFFVRDKQNSLEMRRMFDVTQAFGYKVDISLLYGDKTYFIGINILAIFLFLIFEKLMRGKKEIKDSLKDI